MARPSHFASEALTSKHGPRVVFRRLSAILSESRGMRAQSPLVMVHVRIRNAMLANRRCRAIGKVVQSLNCPLRFGIRIPNCLID